MKKTKTNKTQTTGSYYGSASAAEVKAILSACYTAHMPVMLVGDPGVGKTALINSWCRANKFGEPVLLIGSQMEPQDVAGLPMMGEMCNSAGDIVPVTNYGAPSWQMKIMNGESKVIFMDEFSNSPAAIQSGLLKLVGDRTFGNGEKLPEDALIVMAMNPEDTAVDYTPIAAPMANRICWVSYKPSDSEVFAGLAGDSDWYTEEQKAAWSDSEKVWRDRIVSFLRDTGGAYILDFDKVGDSAGTQDSTSAAYDMANSSSELEIGRSAWASPRSWDNAARVLGALGNTPKVTPIQDRIVRGIVGLKCATKFSEWVESHNDVDPFELIRHPELQDWHVSNNEGSTYDAIKRIASSVNAAVLKCDGQDGRPGVDDALRFYEIVTKPEIGGGPHFVSAITSGGEQAAFINTHKPENVTVREWKKRWTELMIQCRVNNYIPDANEVK